MNFSCDYVDSELIWDENYHINELIVESPVALRNILQNLFAEKDKPTVHFTAKGKPISLKKDIDVVSSPLQLNFNNRKAMTALLKLLVKDSLSESFYVDTNNYKSEIIRYLNTIINFESFAFELDTEDFAIDDIAKAIGLHIVNDEDDFIEQLADYMAMMTELVKTKLFVFINLRSLITDGELAKLIGNIYDHQLDVLLIENQQYGRINEVDRIIIDRDMCEI